MWKRVQVLVAAVLAFGLLACSSGTGSKAQKKVIFMYPIKIDALEAVERGIRDELAQDNIEFGVESAQGNSELFQPTVRAAIRQNPDLLVSIGTQISQAAIK